MVNKEFTHIIWDVIKFEISVMFEISVITVNSVSKAEIEKLVRKYQNRYNYPELILSMI